MSRVDVIVPCYGYGHFLEECVESVLTQEGVEVRVLILDDASPDNTPEVGARLAASDARVHYRRHTVNCRHIATFNEGLDWAAGDYLLLLSADDLLWPGALGRAAAMMDAHPDINLVFGNALNRYGEGPDDMVWPLGDGYGADDTRIFDGEAFIRRSGACNIVPTPTAVVRTTAQKRVGGYRTDLPHAGDMEMWLRFAAIGDVGFIGAVQGVYRRHGANMSEAYTGDRVLADLKQRALAFDIFRREQPAYLATHPDLSDYLSAALAREAIRCASMALSWQRDADVRAIKDFAREVDPQIWLSWPWLKATGKQLLGYRLLSALWPVDPARG